MCSEANRSEGSCERSYEIKQSLQGLGQRCRRLRRRFQRSGPRAAPRKTEPTHVGLAAPPRRADAARLRSPCLGGSATRKPAPTPLPAWTPRPRDNPPPRPRHNPDGRVPAAGLRNRASWAGRRLQAVSGGPEREGLDPCRRGRGSQPRPSCLFGGD